MWQKNNKPLKKDIINYQNQRKKLTLFKRHNQKNKDNPQTRRKYCNRKCNLQRAYIRIWKQFS